MPSPVLAYFPYVESESINYITGIITVKIPAMENDLTSSLASILAENSNTKKFKKRDKGFRTISFNTIEPYLLQS